VPQVIYDLVFWWFILNWKSVIKIGTILKQTVGKNSVLDCKCLGIRY